MLAVYNQGVIYNATGKPAPWTVTYPISFQFTTLAAIPVRYSGGFNFSEIILSTSQNSLTYKDVDNNNNSGGGDKVLFLLIGI